jgi:hypothetical protein
MVESAISAGIRVIYRPHPYSFRAKADLEIINKVHALLAADSGRDHLYGKAATGISETEAINQSTAMVSDISGIVSDWLFSLKPYLLVSMDYLAKDFEKRYPVAKGGLILDQLDHASIAKAIAELVGEDTKLAERKKVRDYYFEGANDKDLTKRFVEALRATLK